MDERLLEIKRLLTKGELKQALEIAREIEDEYWRSYALKWIAESYVTDPKRAIEIATSIAIPSIRDEAFRSLVYFFSKAGEFKRAVEAAKKIKSQFIRKKAFRTVSNFLARTIISRGMAGIRLSDLNLDEGDIEALKPLPYGIVYEDGKLMPGAEILPLRGETREGIFERLGEPKKHRVPQYDMEHRGDTSQYVVEYILKLIKENKLKEAEKLIKGLPEPMRSHLLEEAGVKFLENGLEDDAESIFEELQVSNVLGPMLAKRHLDDVSKVQKYLLKVWNPVARLIIAYELAKIKGTDEKLLDSILSCMQSTWKKGRVLKFLAFEMLREAKSSGDDRLRGISKQLFELGSRLERLAFTREN